jgi:hypothetical protein
LSYRNYENIIDILLYILGTTCRRYDVKNYEMKVKTMKVKNKQTRPISQLIEHKTIPRNIALVIHGQT